MLGFGRSYVTQAQLAAAVKTLNERINLMATQAEIDALTTALTQVSTDLATTQSDLAASSTKLQAEINALSAANPTLDLTALQAAAAPIDGVVEALDTAAQQIGALVPTPPAT